ncbi:Bug family tripartite tricarboxylate transporter substrate binding protein [Sagittula salina]|uniref:Tripartite tricarboxylate transporter substrate binding protein n=1 Tax=Sagittula salina TaxID=2820268 RepID=A0A940MTF2_9RHOB|nr:tripartite tricarboxylate transporter substrate binding protein [Sagittula salina]MBP0484531.1 tripartite tricarboxylate transporter substrate binding protein [Sagittula salina]
MTMKSLTLGIAVGAVLTATSALADYPERAVTIIVPFSAGGNTDSIARIAAEHLSDELGRPVVVENRGGGGGTIGSAMVAKADADGYTLLFGTTGTHNVNPRLREVDYDPIADFTPISAGVVSSVLIVANPEVQADTLADLMTLTASDAGAAMNFSSGGVGTVAHVAGELYNQKTGSHLLHIPYGGAGEAMNDLVAGRVQLNMNNVPAFLSHIESGAVKPLAIAAEKRSKLLPDVPTTAEQGLNGFVMGSWYGLMGPKGLPENVVQILFDAMATLDEDATVVERYKALGLEAAPSESPAAFADFIAAGYVWWGETLDNPVFKE